MAATTHSLASIFDVFLSFRGEDTRHGFTGNLYRALCDKGIHTFFDEEKLHSGEEITPALLKAIKDSRIAITVLSELLICCVPFFVAWKIEQSLEYSINYIF